MDIIIIKFSKYLNYWVFFHNNNLMLRMHLLNIEYPYNYEYVSINFDQNNLIYIILLC